MRHGLRKVSQVLPGAVGRDEVLRTAKAQQILREWPEIVGEGLASRSRPDRYSKGTVWVAVQGSAWAQELRMRKDMILERLRTRSGDHALFTDVRFGVRPLPAREKFAEPEVESSPVIEEDDTPMEMLSIREIAERRLKNWKRDEG